MSVAQFRNYKIPVVPENAFFKSDTTANEKFAVEDLAKSGLELDNLGVRPDCIINLPEGSLAGYMIPYYNLEGNPIVDARGFLAMYRIRIRQPEFSKAQRYTQPTSDQLAKLELPGSIPYINPLTLSLPGDTMICAEGEKKTAAIQKYLGLPCFGIGGYYMWRHPDKSGMVHPWIMQLLHKRGIRKLTIVPDGDIHRYDICTAYGNYVRALQNEGIEVKLLDPGDKIDDLLVKWGPEAVEAWSQIKPLGDDDLIESPVSLIKKYSLAFKTDSKDRPQVYQHTANVMKLMKEHPAFPKVWQNMDNGVICVGDDKIKPQSTELEIANFFQYNLGFYAVSHKVIRDCVGALARDNQRSPFLEYVKAVKWDGKLRLATWMERIWNVPDSEFVREVSVKWLVGACARLAQPGTKIDWMLITIGKQKTGKTSMPAVLFKGNYLPIYGDQNDKDLHQLLHSHLCVGFDELDSFTRKEASMLKAMITRQEDAFRPPYGAVTEIFPRRFTLYGCGNKQEFLQNDPTGYRRYAIIEITHILDFKKLEVERDQLWAEAWAIYETGNCQFWEVEGASENAEQFAATNLLEERIEEFIARKKIDKSGSGVAKDGKLYLKMSELLAGIGEDFSRNSFVTKDAGNLLAKMGFKKPAGPGRHPDTQALGRYYTLDCNP